MIDVLANEKQFDHTNLVGSDLSRARQLSVETVTIDDVLLQLGLLPPLIADPHADRQTPPRCPPISVLKLDCEGCEPHALLGAVRMFRHNPPQYIVTEVR